MGKNIILYSLTFFFYENVIILYLFINKIKVNALNEIYIILVMFKSCYFVFPMNLNCFQFKFTFALKQNFLLISNVKKSIHK